MEFVAGEEERVRGGHGDREMEEAEEREGGGEEGGGGGGGASERQVQPCVEEKGMCIGSRTRTNGFWRAQNNGVGGLGCGEAMRARGHGPGRPIVTTVMLS